jgi:hypothetical protein
MEMSLRIPAMCFVGRLNHDKWRARFQTADSRIINPQALASLHDTLNNGLPRNRRVDGMAVMFKGEDYWKATKIDFKS